MVDISGQEAPSTQVPVPVASPVPVPAPVGATEADVEVKKEGLKEEKQVTYNGSGNPLEDDVDMKDTAVINDNGAPAGEKRKRVDDESVEDNKKPSELVSNGTTENFLLQTAIVPIVSPQLSHYNLKTGICYDVRMRYHSRIVTSSYDYVDPHPEDPRRIYRIYKAIAEAGLITDPMLQGTDDLGALMKKIPVREASDEEILLVHTKEHLDFIESSTTFSRERLIEETEKGDSIYLNNDSYLAAKLSCGGAIEACRAVVERRVKNAIAVVRPPGHHAEPDAPGGFCLFSNVAVAANAILKQYPESVRRILILDWDVHHGNGTQKAFLNDPRVLYISLHRYEGGKFYPGTTAGAHTVVGQGEGEGYNVNIPWSVPGMGDGDYMYAFERVVLPIAFEFDPDLVIISSGFDAAEGDIIGGCMVTPAAYGQMTHMLKGLSNGNLVVILEGGYTLSAIAASALAVTKVLIGDPPGIIRTRLPSTAAVEVIDKVLKVQSKYWKSIRPGYYSIRSTVDPALTALMGTNDEKVNGLNTKDDSLTESEQKIRKDNKALVLKIMAQLPARLSDGLREFQSRTLFNKYDLTSLPVLKSTFAAPIENQILATPDVHKKDALIVIVHDSPEIWAHRDPLLGNINPGESLVLDGAEDYISWAVSCGYGVIDVSIPEDSKHQDEYYSQTVCAQETMLYLWDSYIEYFSAKNITFIGIGEAYAGIVYLVGHREVRDKADAVISYIGNAALKSIVPIIDEYVADWFFKSSLIFTSHDHSAWDPSINTKKPRKRFGRVVQCQSTGLYETIREKFEETTLFIRELVEDE